MGRRGRHELFSLVDKALDGRLVELLKERRDAGDSYDAIAKMLFERHDIDVSGETVRRWWNDITEKQGSRVA